MPGGERTVALEYRRGEPVGETWTLRDLDGKLFTTYVMARQLWDVSPLFDPQRVEATGGTGGLLVELGEVEVEVLVAGVGDGLPLGVARATPPHHPTSGVGGR